MIGLFDIRDSNGTGSDWEVLLEALNGTGSVWYACLDLET